MRAGATELLRILLTGNGSSLLSEWCKAQMANHMMKLLDVEHGVFDSNKPLGTTKQLYMESLESHESISIALADFVVENSGELIELWKAELNFPSKSQLRRYLLDDGVAENVLTKLRQTQLPEEQITSVW